MMVAQACDLEVGEFIHTSGDAHLYLNHLDQAQIQLSRNPRPLPVMRINPGVTSSFGFGYETSRWRGTTLTAHSGAGGSLDSASGNRPSTRLSHCHSERPNPPAFVAAIDSEESPLTGHGDSSPDTRHEGTFAPTRYLATRRQPGRHGAGSQPC